MGETYTDSDRRYLLIATCLASIITPLMSTMMNLSLLSIGADFDVGSHSQAYVNTMFLLGSVCCMVPAARYASIHGMRRVFLLGLLTLIVSCILTFLSPNFQFLILMRFVIGFGSGMLMVTSIAMLTCVFPIANRGRIIGINTTFVYLGLSVGPTIGGIITDALGWRYIFIFILCLSILSFILVSGFRKEVLIEPEAMMDWKGSVLWGMMIVVLMLGMVNITTEWGPWCVIVGSALLVALWYYLRNSEQPALNSRMFRNLLFTRSCVAAFMNYGASYCITFFLALYLQRIGQMSATEAGALMLVQPLMQILLTMKMGALSDRMTDKRILPAVGMALTGAGVAMYLFLDTNYSLPYVVVMMAIIGLGLGTFSAPNNSLILSSVPPHFKGEASGVLSVVRQTGMMISMSLAMSMISIIMGSTDNLTPENYGIFLDVIHYTFTVCLVMCAVGVICSLIPIKGAQDLN
ncbi:MAG: MFS transporter [archaeon]|nr:MFS transporter [archaeon]